MNPNEITLNNTVAGEGLEFKKKRHEGWNTSTKIIEDIIDELFSSPISEKKKLEVGENNEVYDIKTESGQEVIIRIHRESPRFEKERWALERCAEIGIPVPTILLIRDIVENGQDLQVCVETKIDGYSLDKTPPEDLSTVLLELGQILSLLHSIPTNGFGRLDKEGNGKFSTSADLIRGNVDTLPSKILPYFKDKPEQREILERAYEILDREADKYSSTEPRLAHNDIQPNHILVKDGKISGLIDFESACGADPILDFVLWDYKYGKEYPLEALGIKCDERELNFWKIYRILSSLSYCIENGKQGGIIRSVKAIEDILKYINC